MSRLMHILRSADSRATRLGLAMVLYAQFALLASARADAEPKANATSAAPVVATTLRHRPNPPRRDPPRIRIPPRRLLPHQPPQPPPRAGGKWSFWCRPVAPPSRC
jgi:hypothetical protein